MIVRLITARVKALCVDEHIRELPSKTMVRDNVATITLVVDPLSQIKCPACGKQIVKIWCEMDVEEGGVQ